ncbi:cytochrome c oxidase assembly protein [Cellulosimicrobium cellulans]|uniref:cytochrome c oxidase assembly protein n=1 Tax=Cellulosimicrobium cellulans TaxID=1710 RepID=UPI0008487EDE|nr:cytochrome c oxidase assembly protein [Cellulosimicrobium cellulans]
MTTHVHHPPAHGAAPDVVGWLVPVLVLAVLVGAYLALVARRERALGRRWGRGRTAAWAAGSALLALAVSPPVADLAHADARGHMVQHLLLGMYAPLGLVLGAPVTLLLGAATTAGRRQVAAVLRSLPVRVLSHPLVAGVVDMGGLYVLYLTGLYAASMSSTLLHGVVNVHFVLAGTLFTWAVAGPDPAPHRPGVRVRVVALVLAAGAHAYLAKLLYARAGELPPGGHHTAAEVESAAQWMYYGGDLAEVALAVALFAGWYRARGRRRDASGGVWALPQGDVGRADGRSASPALGSGG